MAPDSKPLWIPPLDVTSTSAGSASPSSLAILRFMQAVRQRHGLTLSGYPDLHQWSIQQSDDFWSLVWDFCDVKGEKGSRIVHNSQAMPGAQFFPDAKLNFAENLLRTGENTPALVFRAEDKIRRTVTHRQLVILVSQLQQLMQAQGVGIGDRIAAMMPNCPETIAIMLAAASLGAVFSSCSPDFGERGVVDRFGQIQPKLFFICDGYWYAGKRISLADKAKGIVTQLSTLKATFVVPYLDANATADVVTATQGQNLQSALVPYQAKPLVFVRLPFNHPLYILFSSGTTGVPKCIVHGAGGTLLQHLKEHQLHCDLKQGEKLFYFSTCGWMMWNWLVSGLASGAVLMLFDGSPFHPTPSVLFDFAAEEKFSIFGTSAKYIDTARKYDLKPRYSHDLSSVRLITSTGSPLSSEGFDYVYDAISPTAQLASISGGTDIVSCFVLGNPLQPVYRGEIMGPGLGMSVDVWNDQAQPVIGEKGELICNKPFPAMPVMFWNDPGNQKYKSAYFDRFPQVWCHGDFAERTERGGFIIHGRSDATLNPGGVRIGTAEIYAQVEQIPEVMESLAIGQDWDNDVRVVLFVRMKDSLTLDESLQDKIRKKIRTGASPRHVPAKIIQVADIPRTKSGKITELAVRDIVHGRVVKNQEALANPEALAYFSNLPELKS